MNFINREWTAHKPAKASGFTIIELLAVIAVIAIFMSVIGLALSSGGESAALDSSQRKLSAAMSGARSQAATKQQPVLVLIAADENDPETFLRSIRIAPVTGYVTNAGSRIKDVFGNDIPIVHRTGDPTLLDRGAFIVPSEVTANRFLQSGNATDILGEYLSQLASRGLTVEEREQRTSNAVYGDVRFDLENETRRFLYFKFNASGFSEGHRVVLAPAEPQPRGIRFTKPEQAIGLLVRPYGSVTLISDPRGFQE